MVWVTEALVRFRTINHYVHVHYYTGVTIMLSQLVIRAAQNQDNALATVPQFHTPLPACQTFFNFLGSTEKINPNN